MKKCGSELRGAAGSSTDGEGECRGDEEGDEHDTDLDAIVLKEEVACAGPTPPIRY